MFMKKKFINGLLLVALFVGFTSSMVSCKDYDDEKVGDAYGVIADIEASLKAALEAQKKMLQDQIDELTKSLNECKSTCAEFRDKIQNELKNYVLVSDYNKFIQEYNQFKDNLGNIYYTKEQVNNLFYNKEEINNLFTNYYTKEEIINLFADYYKKGEIDSKFTNYYTKEEIDELLGKYATNEDLQKLEDKLANYYTKQEIIDLLNTTLAGYATKEDVANLKNEIEEKLKDYVTKDALAQTIADLLNEGNTTLITSLNNWFLNNTVIEEYFNNKVSNIINQYVTVTIVSVNDSISKVKAIANEALELAKQNKIDIDSLKLRVSNLETTVVRLDSAIIKLDGRLDNVSAIANEAKAKAEANSILINNLSQKFDLLDGRVSALEDELAALKEKIYNDSLAADALHREMLETISGLVESLNGNAETIGELQEQLNDNVEALSDSIDSIVTNIQEINISINQNTVVLQKLTKTFENVMAKFITGILINGTDSPLFGELSFPVDVRSNILVAYYGKLDDYGIKFPTNRPAYYALPAANQWEMITDEDIEMIGALEDVPGYLNKAGNETIVAQDGAEGNAGTLYLTVNPTNRDFTGTEFELINSLNETSSVKLSDITKSEHLLTFGYTRGAVTGEQSKNGFYEAKATIDANSINDARLSIDFDETSLKATIKDIENTKDGFNMTTLANAIYKNVSHLLEATAVKATWEDSLGTRSVVSQYAIAAAAAKPLSFAFAKDLADQEENLTDKLEEILDKIIDKINIDFPDFPVSDIVITNVVRKTVGQETDKWTVTFQIKLNGEVKTFKVEVRVNESSVDDGIDLVEAFNDFIDEYNDINIDKTADKVKDSLISNIIEAIDKHIHLKNFLKEPSKLIQPVLLVKANDSYARLSASHNYAARVNATEFYLVPTTYTAEIIAPAYKKFVAVTNVTKGNASAKGGDAACKELLAKANAQEGMKKVFNGGISDESFILFTAEAGYTYEILYSAVDYSGKVVTKKFYVKAND